MFATIPLTENDTIMPGARSGRGLVYAFMGKPMSSYDHDRYSERPSLHDVRYHAFVACLTGKPMSPSCNQKRICFPSDETLIPTCGARRDRTDDLLLAKQALSQLSYGP